MGGASANLRMLSRHPHPFDSPPRQGEGGARLAMKRVEWTPLQGVSECASVRAMATEENKQLAAYLRASFARDVEIVRYADAKDVNTVDILTAHGTPVAGVTAHATLGLSDHSLGLELDGAPLRAELILALKSELTAAATLLANCAFNIINAGYKTGPGFVHPEAMAAYAPGSAMRHVLLQPAFSWVLETQRFESKTVAWLQLLPIGDSELAFSETHGAEALETLIDQSGVDPFDPMRRSVI